MRRETILMFAFFGLAAVLAWAISHYSKSSSRSVDQVVQDMEAEADCTQRGEAYFKEIGSYPTLSDGRPADIVIGQRCRRSTHAFDGLN